MTVYTQVRPKTMAISSRLKKSVNRILNPLGYEIITTRQQRSEVARLQEAKSQGHWDEPRYAAGLSINDTAMLNLLERVGDAFRNDYDKLPRYREESSSEHSFHLNNSWFESVDAEVLYGMIRLHKPARIIEVGSGNSTKLMWKAISDGGLETHVTSIDPQPRIPIVHQSHEHIAARVETLAVTQIADQLNTGDILFIDSSHVVSSAGDIPYLFLEVLAHLKLGVLVHIHDIFIPFDYPELFIIDRQWKWTEQYLVHAFLAHNTAYEILWLARYMWEYHRPAVELRIPSSSSLQITPSSLWIKRTS